MDPSALLPWIGRGVGTVAGLLLLYAAVFLYPNERREIHSRMEGWWVVLDDARLHALTRQPVLVQRIGRTSRAAFEWLFGPPLGKRFFVLSGLLSMISFSVALSTLGDYGWAVPSGLLVFGLTTVWAVMQFGGPSDRMYRELESEVMAYQRSLWQLRDDVESGRRIGTIAGAAREIPQPIPLASDRGLIFTPPPARSPPQRSWSDEMLEYLPMAAFATLVTSSTGLVLAGAIERGIGTGPFLFAILTAFVCDAVSVYVTMEMLERLGRTRTALTAAGWLLFDATIAAAMLLIPLALHLYLFKGEGSVGTFVVFLASANVSTALPSLAYLLIALGLLLHRLLWPAVLRPFYNVVHAERIQHPKTLGMLGLALLAASWPEMLSPLRPLVEEVLGLL
jgi:hypothetical protein